MKTIKEYVSILLLFATVISVISLTGCDQKRSTDFKSVEDMANYLNGTWMNQEDKTYIFIKKGEIEHYDEVGDYCFLDVSRYSFPAKANWNNAFDNIYLGLRSPEELNDKTYYCSDQQVMMGLGLGGESTDLIGGFICKQENVEQKMIDDDLFGNRLKINDDGTVTMNGKDKPEKTYEFVSSDPEWFFKNTKKLWDKAAKKELDDRKNRFEKFKAFYCDKTKFSDFTKNDLSKVCEWISNGYEEIKGAGVLAYENISEQMNLFLYAMGYFSTYDKDTVGYNLADKGWKAVEYYLYNIDVEKSQAAWEDFKTYYNDNLGKIMYPIK
ncbi:MAG: hypothetical protein J5879_00915 [Clostridia bacterium]|nr:hypothetical protein [Clostridia bacterium]